MNSKNLAMTSAIGLVYLLLGTSLFLQFRQSNPLTPESVKLTLQEELSPLERQLGLLQQEIDDMKKGAQPTARVAAPDTQIGQLQNELAKTNKQIEDLAKKVDAVHTELFASSKSLAQTARQPESRSKLSDFLGNVDSDPQLKSEFEKAIQSVVPQKQWGKLIVTNHHNAPVVLTVDSPGEQGLLQHIPAAQPAIPATGTSASIPLRIGTFEKAFPVGTKVVNPRGGHWTIEAPEFELHLEIFGGASGAQVLKSRK